MREELIKDLHNAVFHEEPVSHPKLLVKTDGEFPKVTKVVTFDYGPEAAAGLKRSLITFEEMM